MTQGDPDLTLRHDESIDSEPYPLNSNLEKNLTKPQYPKRIGFPVALAVICLAILLLLYGATLVARSMGAYQFIKLKAPTPRENQGLTIGQPFSKLDPILGTIPAPNANGAFLIPLGEPVPFHNDDESLRAPLGVTHSFNPEKRPRLMFFGDSFTYGEMVSAEDTFVFRSAAILGGQSINAGVPGYNLAQMLLRARRLAPKYQPDYLVVQYSPWLVTRAEHGYATGSKGYLMAPFFYQKDGQTRVSPALFSPPSWLLTTAEKYKYSKPSIADEISFVFDYGAPFLAHHDLNMAILLARQLFGLAPTPSTNHAAIVQFAYQQFDQLAKQHHGQLVILILGYAWPLDVPYNLFPPDAVVINGWAKLVERLNPMTPNNYIRHYFLYRGDPPQPVDGHPNEKADAIVADAIVDVIDSNLRGLK